MRPGLGDSCKINVHGFYGNDGRAVFRGHVTSDGLDVTLTSRSRHPYRETRISEVLAAEPIPDRGHRHCLNALWCDLPKIRTTTGNAVRHPS